MLTKKQKEELKFFLPKYLTGYEWLEDQIQNMLDTYFGEAEIDNKGNNINNTC